MVLHRHLGPEWQDPNFHEVGAVLCKGSQSKGTVVNDCNHDYQLAYKQTSIVVIMKQMMRSDERPRQGLPP